MRLHGQSPGRWFRIDSFSPLLGLMAHSKSEGRTLPEAIGAVVESALMGRIAGFGDPTGRSRTTPAVPVVGVDLPGAGVR
ncbi:hypothetical protein Bxe_A1282 [Paraburkholderia xenovorans LB400]|uniref:Uncharacterized protein n=1 Tax=Paraburkholderia xenovorans (strain LB400) TaxID=266265 RepID=Q13W68_PARXL|nr:hypothetical protein Bxe_A1282 [Paraburkholderia xenovorans LB400]